VIFATTLNDLLDPYAAEHIVVFSGGMDSYTLLMAVASKLWDRTQLQPAANPLPLQAVSFFYGQRHRRELQAASAVCQLLGIKHTVLSLPVLGQIAETSGSSLISDSVDVPHGHYAEESMKKTVVPGRNTLMLAATLAFAEGTHPGKRIAIYYGAHSGDHAIYPDCRPEFVVAMKKTFLAASEDRVRLHAPWLNLSKGEILAVGRMLTGEGVALDYGLTWTCYEGGEHPCGKCGACVERAEAFASVNQKDPLLDSLLHPG